MKIKFFCYFSPSDNTNNNEHVLPYPEHTVLQFTWPMERGNNFSENRKRRNKRGKNLFIITLNCAISNVPVQEIIGLSSGSAKR